jgi:hypothetical protein
MSCRRMMCPANTWTKIRDRTRGSARRRGRLSGCVETDRPPGSDSGCREGDVNGRLLFRITVAAVPSLQRRDIPPMTRSKEDRVAYPEDSCQATTITDCFSTRVVFDLVCTSRTPRDRGLCSGIERLHEVKRLRLREIKLAEREGFEPSIQVLARITV